MAYEARPLAERFWEKVDTTGGADACWPWKACRRPAGYGLFTLNKTQMGGRRYKSEGAHRVAWSLANNAPVPDGHDVCHRCDNPPCCNPAHLFSASSEGNTADRHAKGRDARGSGHGMWRPERHQPRIPKPRPRGENNARSRLTEDKVREIRRKSAEGLGHRQLAVEFGVAKYSIFQVVHRLTWAHVV